MATLNLNDPQNGTTADASLIATNNAAIKTVVNGGLEDGNIASGADIGIAKLDGYPSDNTKFLRGDGTWNAPIAGGFTPSAPATSLPVSPANLQQAILVDSTSAPTYAWFLQYSSSVSKWIFIGGSPLHKEVATSENVTATSYDDASTVVGVTVPRAGSYYIENGATITAEGNGVASVGIKVGSSAAADSLTSTGSSVLVQGGVGIPITATAAASDVIKQQYKTNGSGTQTQRSRWIKVTPITVT